MKKIYTLLALALLCGAKSFSQCAPSATYTSSGYAEAGTPATSYSGYVCDGHDTLVTQSGIFSQFYDGDGYRMKLISGGQYRIAIDAATTPCSITIVDSAGTTGSPIVGAYAAPASPYNSLIFTAPYTGTYYVSVNANGTCGGSGATGICTGSVKLLNSVNCPAVAAVPNDSICSAIAMTDGVLYSGNTSGASASDASDADAVAAGYACFTPNNTVWYSFTPTATSNYNLHTVSPAGGLNMWVGLFEGTSTCTNPLTYVDCSAGAVPGGNSSTLVSLTGGTTYYLMIDGNGGSVGAYSISLTATTATAPANGDVCSALTLVPGVVYNEDNSFATATDLRDTIVQIAGFTCSTPNNTMWYNFTPAVSDTFIVTTNAPATGGLNAWIVVLNSTDCFDNAPTLVIATGGDSCNSACAPGVQSKDTFALVGGTNYYIMMDGRSGSTGAYTIKIDAITVGISKLVSAKNIEVYPNPSTGVINFTTTSSITSLDVYNAIGAKVYSESKLTSGAHSIDLSQFGKGIYTVKVLSEGKVDVKKITIN